ncbi:hypothetical protein [Escherichia coli]|uniref:hypothetical protein n=1 Tax=Escherichia coli TaxID=562 RepID=UPI0020361576|nr:hypothetical protein [Escherichia coli]
MQNTILAAHCMRRSVGIRVMHVNAKFLMQALPFWKVSTKHNCTALKERYEHLWYVSNVNFFHGILLKTKEVGVYISLSTIFFICLAIWLLRIWQDCSVSHAAAVRNKNALIKEAENVVLSMDHLSWTEMTTGQQEVYECAIERLRLLKSYKKNHAPDSFPFLKEWPRWYDPKKATINR